VTVGECVSSTCLPEEIGGLSNLKTAEPFRVV
jgi:hypothetical protein